MNPVDRSDVGVTGRWPGGARSSGRACQDELSPVRTAVLQAFAELSEDALLYLDDDGRIADWNPSTRRIFGHRPDELLDLPFTKLFPAHFRDDVQALLGAVAAGEWVQRFETEIKRRDEMPLAVSLSLCPVPSPAPGTPVAVVVRDITEQRLAQAALAEAQARARDSEAMAHVGSWLWDVRTGTVQWSDELHRIHGLDPLDFDGTLEAHLGLVDEADRPRILTMLDDAVASGRPFEAEYRIRRPDGEVRHILVRGEPTHGSAGTVVGLRGIGHDVTGQVAGSEGPSAGGAEQAGNHDGRPAHGRS